MNKTYAQPVVPARLDAELRAAVPSLFTLSADGVPTTLYVLDERGPEVWNLTTLIDEAGLEASVDAVMATHDGVTPWPPEAEAAAEKDFLAQFFADIPGYIDTLEAVEQQMRGDPTQNQVEAGVRDLCIVAQKALRAWKNALKPTYGGGG